MNPSVRPAAVAGMFYPDEPDRLTAELARCLAPTGGETLPVPKAIVAPHAGYVYSGTTAGRAYALLKAARAISRVILLGPCHRVAVRGMAVPTVSAYATPLGEVPIDRATVDSLLDLPQVSANDRAHAMEHSLEVHLPFLQTALPAPFTLVPLAVGRAEVSEVSEVLDRLWGGEETLIVVSTDLSHFLPYREAQAIDRATCEAILTFDSRLTGEQACGAFPLNGFLRCAHRHGLKPELIVACNSGDTAGDRNRVVGYASFAFYTPEKHHG